MADHPIDAGSARPVEFPRSRQHGFLPRDNVLAIGFARIGQNVQIDESARFYGANRIAIGSNVRIDAFAVLSAGPGGIVIGDYNHLAVGVLITGGASVELADFVGLSAHTKVYSSNDDYTGLALTGPTVPDRFRKISTAPVAIGAHVIVGAGSIILPGVTIGKGAAVGALSIVKRDVDPFAIVVGSSGRVIGTRQSDFLRLEMALRSEHCDP